MLWISCMSLGVMCDWPWVCFGTVHAMSAAEGGTEGEREQVSRPGGGGDCTASVVVMRDWTGLPLLWYCLCCNNMDIELLQQCWEVSEWGSEGGSECGWLLCNHFAFGQIIVSEMLSPVVC